MAHGPNDTDGRLGGLPASALPGALERSADAVALLDREGRHLWVNPAYSELLGYDRPGALEGRHWETLLPGDELERVKARSGESLRREGSWRGEVMARDRHGDPLPLDLTLTPVDPHRLLCVARDYSRGREIQERLERMAYYDPLTGLANRRLLREKTDHALALAERGGHEVALLYMDLDSFKEINDTLGHAAGDRTLEEVSRRLEEAVRDADTAARVGGDEFALLMAEVEGEEGAVRVARRILKRLERPVEFEGHSLEVGASIGVAIYPRYADDFDELMRQADLAMYGAGRGKEVGIRIFRPEHGIVTPRRTGLASDLQEALRHYRFEVHYQPIRGLESGRIEGAQALVRWPHPRLGTLCAAKFLPLVEEVGLLRRLDRWVIATAVLQAGEWQREGFEGWMAVHVSDATCRDPRLSRYLERVMAAADTLDPGRVVLQVPAREALDDPERFRRLREEIHGVGARMAVNAFGPGIASVDLLRELGPEMLSLDRSLIDAAEREAGGQKRIQVAVDVAHTLGAQVLAKGVERPAQRDLLRAAGCDFSEGYLEGWSVPAEDFLDRAG
jgi:diguanylate cyclase (GGDEF)-like protein/PAS domain S-box-containing protein